MDELINLIIQFNEVLKKQIAVYLDFIPILNEEEQAIAEYNITSLEKVVILKDQHSRIAQNIEEKRISILKKICYMIAFDARGQKLSLKLFRIAFSTYLKNIQPLINLETYTKIQEQENNFKEIANEFENTFITIYPRIFRNEIILKKLLKNVTMSINLFQSEADVGMNYDSFGKAQSLTNKTQTISSMRIKA
jgi:hypothetical protein